jgi:hypothetical protein
MTADVSDRADILQTTGGHVYAFATHGPTYRQSVLGS